MRFVHRVRWLRVSLAGLLTLVGLLSLRLWQWVHHAGGLTAYAERADERAHELDLEIDRLNHELKGARTLVHWRPDEIVQFEDSSAATPRPAAEDDPADELVHIGCECGARVSPAAQGRLRRILTQEYVPTCDWTTFTSDELRKLWTSLSRHRIHSGFDLSPR